MPAYGTTSLSDTPYGKSLRECAAFAHNIIPQMATQLNRLEEAGLVEITEPALLTVFRELVAGLAMTILGYTHHEQPELTPAATRALAEAALGAVLKAGSVVVSQRPGGHA